MLSSTIAARCLFNLSYVDDREPSIAAFEHQVYEDMFDLSLRVFVGDFQGVVVPDTFGHRAGTAPPVGTLRLEKVISAERHREDLKEIVLP